MANIPTPSSLTPIIEVPTEVPFPVLGQTADADGNTQTIIQSSDTAKITLNVCSEFVQHTAPVSTFGSGQILRLAHDLSGQPIVFSLGTDGHLYCLYHIDGAALSWQQADVTPDGDNVKIPTLDVSISTLQKTIFVVISQLESDNTSTIKHVTFPVPNIRFDPAAGIVTGFDPKVDISSKWQTASNNLGAKTVSSLLCGPCETTGAASTTSAFRICVGTEEEGSRTGSYFTVDPSDGVENPWKPGALPEDTEKVLGLQVAATPDEDGVFILYQRPDDQGNGLVRKLIDKDSGDWLGDSRMEVDAIGEPKAIFANINPAHKTDLLVAGSKGIGFFNYRKLGDQPSVVLPEVSFKQVICAEAYDAQTPTTNTKLSIFAVSDRDELYFIQGTRLLHGNEVSFTCSGVPIRSEVEQISTQYNSAKDATELLYVTNAVNEIKHLSRDPASSCWNEQSIAVAAMEKFQAFPAYVTTVAVTDGKGTAAPANYPISLTCEPILVTANDRTYNLDQRPTPIMTDTNGRVTIVLPVREDTLHAPTYTLTLASGTETPFSTDIHPAQRVLRGLAKVKTSDDLRNAKSTTGAPVFPDKHADQLDTCSGVLSNFGSMLQDLDPLAALNCLSEVPGELKEFTVAWQKDADGVITSLENHDWLEAAVDVVHCIGDLFEASKAVVKSVLKVAIRVAVGVVDFVVEVGGLVLKTVIKTAGMLLRSVGGFLKDHLGIDISGFLNWLGFIFDVDQIKKTQEVLKNFIHGLEATTDGFFERNKSTLTDGIGALSDKLKPYIKDTRPPEPNIAKPDGPIAKFLHNPIVQKIIEWNPIALMQKLMGSIMETFGDAIDDLIELPDFSSLDSLVGNELLTLLEDEIDNIARFLVDIYDKVGDIFADPSTIGTEILALAQDGFWTVFDAVKRIIIAAYDIIAGAFKALFEVIEGKWKLPVLTTMWTLFAEQEFSILNVGTFAVAALLDVVMGKPSFEVFADPSMAWNGITPDMLDLHNDFGLPMKTPAPASTQASGIEELVLQDNANDNNQTTGNDYTTGASDIQTDNQGTDGTANDNTAGDDQGGDNPGDDLGANSRLEKQETTGWDETRTKDYEDAFEEFERNQHMCSIFGGSLRSLAASSELTLTGAKVKAERKTTALKKQVDTVHMETEPNRIDHATGKSGPTLPEGYGRLDLPETPKVEVAEPRKIRERRKPVLDPESIKTSVKQALDNDLEKITSKCKNIAKYLGPIFSLCMLAARASSVAFWKKALQNADLANDLSPGEYAFGYITSLSCNCVGAAIHLGNLLVDTEQVASAGNIVLCLGTIVEQILLNLVEGSDAKERIEGGLEVGASCAGITTAILALSEESEPYALISAAADTGVSVVTWATFLDLYLKEG